MTDPTPTLRETVRDVLVNHWDPSEVKWSEAAWASYDGDIDPLLALIRRGASEDAVVDYLYDREREIVCFPGLGRQRLRRVAQKLLALAPP